MTNVKRGFVTGPLGSLDEFLTQGVVLRVPILAFQKLKEQGLFSNVLRHAHVRRHKRNHLSLQVGFKN